jgi:hypothetical protein
MIQVLGSFEVFVVKEVRIIEHTGLVDNPVKRVGAAPFPGAEHLEKSC